MKRNILRRAFAVVMVLVSGLAFSATTYAADRGEEWGLIPDDYVLILPSLEDTVIVGGGHRKESSPDDFAYTLEEFAALHLAETNRIRQEYGLEAFETDPVLTEMAQNRIDEYVPGHKRSDGSEWYTIFDEYDSGLKPTGENMGAAGATPENHARGFLETSHRENILNPEAKYIGIGVKWVDTVIGSRIAVVQLFVKDA